jgi:hypothetical protein
MEFDSAPGAFWVLPNTLVFSMAYVHANGSSFVARHLQQQGVYGPQHFSLILAGGVDASRTGWRAGSELSARCPAA